MSNFLCPVCGESATAERSVLWPELISAWQLSPEEATYVNRQQGFHCKACGNNLRAMTLARAIVTSYGARSTFAEFCASDAAQTLRILEINSAGALTPLLSKLPGHRFVSYPAFDMMRLEIQDDSFDLVVHSDTLEHVPNPVVGLSECARVLRQSGRCIFTVPLIVGRLTRSRVGLARSYHGDPVEAATDQTVHTEFGADAWTHVLRAGFTSCTLHCIEYPAGLALEAR